MNKEKIIEVIKNEYDQLSKEHEVYGVFLYGSQNYKLDTEESDIDTKAIIIPSFEDLVLRKPISKLKKFDCGECDVKDIREMVGNFKKQNVNFIETLFTDYFYVNPKYQEFHDKLMKKRESIARMDDKAALNCLYGMFHQAKTRLTKDTEVTHDDIVKYGYHRKSFMNVYKCAYMIVRYTKGINYKDLLDCSNLERMRTASFKKEEVLANVEKIDQNTREEIRKFFQDQPPAINNRTGEWMDDWMIDVIKTNCGIKIEPNPNLVVMPEKKKKKRKSLFGKKDKESL